VGERLTEEERRLRSILEKDFQAQIIELAGLAGWRLIYHTHDSRRSTAGFPDLVMMRPPEILVLEVKREKGRLTPEQGEWIDGFRACGIEAHVVRPSEWERLVARLRRPAKRSPLA